MTIRNSLPTDLPTGLPLFDTRINLSTLVTRYSDGRPRVGIVPPVAAEIATGRSTMGYNIADFRAITSRTDPGAEIVANDGMITVQTTDAPASNSRIDSIFVRARFNANADGASVPEIGVVQGRTDLNPLAPSVPSGAFELAQVRIPAGVTSTTAPGVVITQTAPFTAAAGGTVVVRNLLELDRWSPAEGALTYRVDEKAIYLRVAGSWGQVWKSGASPYAIAAGYATNPAGAATNVRYPVGRFTVPPIITMTNTGSTVSIMNAKSRSKDFGEMAGFNGYGIPIPTEFFWTAIQTTPTSAAG